MRESRLGEDRDLLPEDDRVQRVDRGDSGLEKIARMLAPARIDRRTADRAHLGRSRRRKSVARPSEAVEDPPEKLGTDAEAERAAVKANRRAVELQAVGRAEDFDDRSAFGRGE